MACETLRGPAASPPDPNVYKCSYMNEPYFLYSVSYNGYLVLPPVVLLV